MRSATVWLGCLLGFALAGAPLLSHPAYRRWGLAARAALSAAIGMFAVSTTMTFWALTRTPWRLPILLAAAFVECLLLRFALPRREATATPERRRRFSPAERVAIAVVAAALLACALATAAASATSTDLALFWGPKANAFASAGSLDAEFLADHLHRYQHASYPPLVPSVWAFAAIAAGELSWSCAIATFPALLALLAAALPGLLRVGSRRRDALAATAAIVASVGIAGHMTQIAGNADPFLLYYEILAVAVLSGTDPDDAPAQLVAGLLLGGGAAAKVEGLPFALCAGVFYALYAFRALRRGPARPWSPARVSAAVAFRLLAPALIAVLGWMAFGRQRAVFIGYESYGPALDLHWNTLGRVLAAVGRSLAAAAFGLPWLVPAAAFLLSLRGRKSALPARLVPAGIALVLSLFYVFTYLHGPDPTLWIGWSGGRIFLVVSPLLAIASLPER